jgi:hypothetical protein
MIINHLKHFVVCSFILVFSHTLSHAQGIKISGGYIKIPSGAHLSTDNLNIENSSTLSVAGNINLSGDWTNNSGATLSITGGTVSFNGTGLQTLSGSNLTEFNNLNIASGSSTIVPAGKYVTVDGQLSISGDFTLLSNASSACASLLDAGNNTGNITVQRHLSGGKRQHLICSPVDNGSLNSIFDATNGNYNVYWYDETNASSNAEDGWTRIISGTLTDARGYTAIYDDWTTRSFEGTLNTGSDITISITKSNSGNPDADGWNLVGNPYPSPIDADAFVGDNPSIYGSLYFFDSDTSGGNDYNTNDYGVYNTITTDTAATGGGSVGIPNGIIAVGQAFFVKKLSSGSSALSFKNTHRTHNSSTQFFTPDPIEIQRIRLSVSNDYGIRNTVYLGFVEDASQGIDRLYDAPKLQGNENLSFYSSWDNGKWAVLGLPLLSDEEVVIPLSVYSGLETKHTIEVDLFENIPVHTDIYLEDNVLSKRMKISEDFTYEFSVKENETSNRFSVLINPSSSSVNNEHIPSITYQVRGNELQLINSENTQGEVIIRDMAGKELLKHSVSSSQQFILNLPSAYYLMSIITDHENITKKIYIQ